MKRQRVSAIIIENKNILLVRDDQADFFSMPGGTLEKDEDHATAMAREIMEEIECSIQDMEFYYYFDSINQTYNVPQENHAYRVFINDTPACSMEICELGWFSAQDIAENKVNVPHAFLYNLYPKLVDENIL